MARPESGRIRSAFSGLLFFIITSAATSQIAATDSGAPNLVALAIQPVSPNVGDSLNVKMTVEPSAEVNSATFFMCIISPKSLCYLPESMTRAGPQFGILTKTLKDYPETTATMDLGVKFRLNTSAGDFYFPRPGTKTEFGFEIANTSADPTGLYYKVHVEESAPPPPPPAKPLDATDSVAALAIVAAAALLSVVVRVRRGKSKRR